MRKLSSMIAPLLLLAACAQSPSTGETEVRYGRISGIEAVQIDSETRLGLGAIAGAVAGGLIGNQFGEGSGNALSTAAGVLAGGAVGSKVQGKVQKQPGQHITIRLNNGTSVSITQPTNPNLQTGDAVRVEGSGNDARVVRM